MSAMWPTAPMGEIAPLVRRPVFPEADKLYREIGLRSFGKGIFHKAPATGLEIGDKRVFAVQPGDLVFNIVFAWEGATAVATEAERGMIGSHRFLTCVADDTRADAKFLNYWFMQTKGREQLLRASPGGAGRNRTLGVEKLDAIHVPLPALGEQCRIVARIEELASKIGEARKTRELAHEELAALRHVNITTCMKSLNADGLLTDVLTAAPRNGWSPSCDNLGSGTPVLTLSAVTGWNFNSSAFKRTSQPTNPTAHYWSVQGDLLITRSNTPELVGHAAIYNGSPNPCIYPDLMMRVPVDPKKASTRFVWYWLQSARARDFIRRSAKGTSPTMKKISQSIVQRVPFPADLTLTTQDEIVRRIDALQARTEAVAQIQAETAAELDAMFPAILDKAFKGEL